MHTAYSMCILCKKMFGFINLINNGLSTTRGTDKSITLAVGSRVPRVIRPHHQEIKTARVCRHQGLARQLLKNSHVICENQSGASHWPRELLKMAPSEYVPGIKLALLYTK